ncbi:MAG: formate--tetrahydrofolate ligase [Bacillota bacterium]|nr:formate--tetrahydrofolate ligase [Bacillota bacterium]
MLSDIEIAQGAKLRSIKEIAESVGLSSEDLEYFGRYKAKVTLEACERLRSNPDGKLIFVTAITATPAGEGKTCTAVGLTQALGYLGKKVMLCLREPSLGPVFGVKGGAAGGGFAQVVPMEDINLHFTGDFAAVAAAHNLLAALLDNHIVQGNELDVDITRVVWKRVLDMNDRQLRDIVVGLGGRGNGIPRETGFEITAASEVMAVLCLAQDWEDLRERLSRLLVAYDRKGDPIYARDLKAVGAMLILLKDAFKPNLVQTLEGQPAFIHGGPFANIAHGNNSVIATRTALKLADYVVTEGGFAADLGAEKFFDIVCPQSGLRPDVAVLVASIRALHLHGGAAKEDLGSLNLRALEAGLPNLEKHVENLRKFGLPVVVALNRFPQDHPEELAFVREYVTNELGVACEVSEVFAAGGKGGEALARAVLDQLEAGPSGFHPLYRANTPLKQKLEYLALGIYGASYIQYTPQAEKDIRELTRLGLDRLPLCVAKTQFSLSDDPALLGAPQGWKLTVREIKPAVGAGFLVVYTGEIRTMPGLPKHPAAEQMDIDRRGKITGLF